MTNNNNNHDIIIDTDVMENSPRPNFADVKKALERMSASLRENILQWYSPERVAETREAVILLEGVKDRTDDEEADLIYFKKYLASYDDIQEKWKEEGEGKSLEEYISTQDAPILQEIIRRAPLPDLKTYGLMNDKVNSNLISSEGSLLQDMNGQLQLVWAVQQEGKGKIEGEGVPTYISLMYEGTETKLTKKMTAYDNAVYNAVATRYYYWKENHPGEALLISPQEVWRTMNGKDDSARPTARQTEKVCKSLDKMRFTRFSIDITKEIEANYIKVDDERLVKGYAETYLLKADKIAFETEKGRTIEGYKISDEPILYTYNRAKNHILYVDYDLLNTSDKKNMGEYTIEFTNYLLLRVYGIANGTFNSNRILLSTLYEKTGIEPPEVRLKRENYGSEASYTAKIRAVAKQDRETIEAILASWNEKKRLIKGFEPVKKGNSLIGYDLEVIKEKKCKGIGTAEGQ